uniref:Acyltransferase 3 domain-containing protein n=1 Tax=Panagrolaimus davidi TaxID=227884 RepID=A0A914Q3K5_9BILA
MSSKIVELQGLRCIAIISVLLYHIWPDLFVNGFLGVDIFFVISGYFMALILLTPKKVNSFKNFTFSFYYRRIYRILPLYLINIFSTLIIVPSISYTLKWPDFLLQIKSALTFSTNFAMLFEDRNYFDTSLSFEWFKHYWSLCVEMQFYAIIPFLAYFCRKLPTWINLFLIWPSIIAVSQCLSIYMLVNFGQIGNNFTFGMLPTRIWQFSAGFCVFYALKYFDEISDCKFLIFMLHVLRHSIITNVLAVLLLSITLFPKILNQAYAQIGTIVLTSILIAGIGRQKEKEELQFSILSNRFIVFIGDASYSLYISHWIFVTFSNILFEHSEASM